MPAPLSDSRRYDYFYIFKEVSIPNPDFLGRQGLSRIG
jgi:hypothetical protein